MLPEVITMRPLKKIELPCAQQCPFGKKCAETYLEIDECAAAIHHTISTEISSKSSELTITPEHLMFTTIEPSCDGLVMDGLVLAFPPIFEAIEERQFQALIFGISQAYLQNKYSDIL